MIFSSFYRYQLVPRYILPVVLLFTDSIRSWVDGASTKHNFVF